MAAARAGRQWWGPAAAFADAMDCGGESMDVAQCNNCSVQELSRTTHGLDAVTDAVLLASRVLVAVAARSLAEVTDDVTLPQFRALVVLASQGPQLIGSLAEQLDVNPSTASRLSERLVRK